MIKLRIDELGGIWEKQIARKKIRKFDYVNK